MHHHQGRRHVRKDVHMDKFQKDYCPESFLVDSEIDFCHPRWEVVLATEFCGQIHSMKQSFIRLH